MTPQDLVRHNCIDLRMMSLGGLYAWELEKDGRDLCVADRLTLGAPAAGAIADLIDLRL